MKGESHYYIKKVTKKYYHLISYLILITMDTRFTFIETNDILLAGPCGNTHLDLLGEEPSSSEGRLTPGSAAM